VTSVPPPGKTSGFRFCTVELQKCEHWCRKKKEDGIYILVDGIINFWDFDHAMSMSLLLHI
jgi:hypothetical protein